MQGRLLNRHFRALIPFFFLCVCSNFLGFTLIQNQWRLIQLIFLPIILISGWAHSRFIFKRGFTYNLLFPAILILSFLNSQSTFRVSFLDWAVSNSYYLFFYLIFYFQALNFRTLKLAMSWFYWAYTLLSYLICISAFRQFFLYVPDNLPPSEAFIPGIQIFVAISIFRLVNEKGLGNLITTLNTLAVVFLTDNRATIFSVSLVIITYLSWKFSFRKVMFILLGMVFTVIMLSSSLGVETIVNISDNDYPRIRAIVYFFTDYFKDISDWLFGFGLGNSQNSLGRLQNDLREVGIFHSDLGLLGTLFQIGLVGLLFIITTIYSMPQGKYGGLIWIYILAGFTMHYFLSPISFVFLALILTISKNLDESLPLPFRERSV